MPKFAMIKKGAGFAILLSSCRFRDYECYIKPERGFSPNIMASSKIIF